MPVTIDNVEVMSDDGAFTDSFTPSILGKDYAETKVFESTPNLLSLAKAYADTKSDYGRKLEGVIQRPGESAGEQEKAEFRKTLLKELGAPESVDAYEFTPPEGIEHDAELVSRFKAFALREGMAPSVAQGLVSLWDTYQSELLEKITNAREDNFNQEVKTLKTEMPGEALTRNGRLAAKALLEFGAKEHIDKIKELRIIDTPDDFVKWRELGVDAANFRILANIGAKMGLDKAITDEGETPPSEKSGEGPDMFDHPTSVAQRKRDAAKKASR